MKGHKNNIESTRLNDVKKLNLPPYNGLEAEIMSAKNINEFNIKLEKRM